MAIEDISHLDGHASTHVTEKVYRKELRPVLTKGARAMDALFDQSLLGQRSDYLGAGLHGGHSQSSASKHASVLRAAGLISSVRTGRSDLHRITPIGVALVYGTRRPIHQRTSRRPIAARDRLPHPLG